MPVPFDRPLARGQFRFEPMPLVLSHPWTIARGTATEKRNGLLTFEAGGVVGMGEAAPNVRYGQTFEGGAAAFERIAGAIEGCSPWDHGRVLARAEAVANEHTEVVSALDMALWDWRGRVLGVPVWRALGFPSVEGAPTSFSIGMDAPEVLRRKVAEASAHDTLKVKLGSQDDRAIVAAVRAATCRRLRVDANEGWSSADEAARRIEWLAGEGVELVEQPLEAADVEGARRLRQRSPLPLVADESVRTIRDLAEAARGFHGVNVKLAKCGGLTRAHELCVAARALGLGVMLGCMIESSLGIAAALALAGFADWIDLDGNLLLARDPFGGLELVRGAWRLPEQPGLGVHPRADAALSDPVKEDGRAGS